MSFLRADIPRQTNNVLRIATVAAIDWEARQFRAQTGDITTNWLPFPAWISHNYRHWLPRANHPHRGRRRLQHRHCRRHAVVG